MILTISELMGRKVFVFPFPVVLFKFLLALVGKRGIFEKIAGDLVVNNYQFVEDFKWHPPYNFQDGLKKTVDWYVGITNAR